MIIETIFCDIIDLISRSIACWFQASLRVPRRRLANTTSSRPARNCSGSFDGGDGALGEAAGEGDREISGVGRDRSADDEGGPPSHQKIIPPADSRRRRTSTPADDKGDNGSDHDRKDKSCFAFHASLGAFPLRCWGIEVLGNNQNCLANASACLFPASIMSTARPSQVCSTVRVTTLRTPMNRSQNST